MDIVKKNSGLMLSVLFMCFSLKSHVSFGADTISANESLSGNQTIISADGVFELGFFSPAPGNSSKYYIGMWYYKVSVQTIVWVANREKPVSDRFSSSLRISDGNLVLFNESKLPIWSTNLTSTTTRPPEAVLLDTGNLVLRDLSNNLSEPLWQSFDHPAHTWIPGMKLRYDKRTKVSQLLTSWKNEEDPAPGLFSLELAPDGSNSYVILWNRSEQYWSSGPWDENQKIFSLVPEMRLNYIYNFSYVSNENESYFTYSVKDATTSRFVMDVSGQIKQMNWLEGSKAWFLFWSQPRQQCEVYAYCGQFSTCNELQTEQFCTCLQGFQQKSENDWNLKDYSGGCVRKTRLQCENNSLANGKSDKFLEYPNMALPEHPQSVAVESIKECATFCLNNCSCTAYSYEDNGCSIWNGNFLGLQQLAQGGKTFYLKLAASEFPSSKNSKGIVIGGVLGSVALVVLIGLMMLVYFRRRKRATKETEVVEGSLVAFTYKDLQTATKNFSDKLGGGGFGSVFKGVLPNSSVIAVKKLESLSQGEKQFRTEVSTIGNIQHVNLVRLLGFCSEGTKRLLVYDYMANGSLDSHLFHEKDSKVLDWKTRYQIALGTARGLAYLHEKCRDCIIHCDIKPENILLDAELCPKVADFGLAKLVGREFSRVLTTMRGTRGYLAPEWISGVAITTKADVYSYGMMLFEIVSGRRNSEQSEDGRVKFFPTWAAKLTTEGGDLLSLLDPRLEGNADVEELSRICKVACWCIQDEETHRPSMGQVVQILEGVLDVTMPPIPRSLQVFVDNQEHIIFFTESSSSQSSHSRSNTSTASSQAKSTSSSTNS
ncbi:S-receptor-like serine/threonine-protein kinase [Melia azedarach]|uniref:S-receptor-like serine/threonine-protein kinase n=2 Tax=Melia azedarach TaxID=155640 RepID=A0ACC1Z3V1_MELAZ|nr:S-receptor-like serine/threonine-protein kinase [Melia azedarach]KAJ4729929.1 S-receptor-like serine/threonine-protein kinase [Melia azedarach]